MSKHQNNIIGSFQKSRIKKMKKKTTIGIIMRMAENSGFRAGNVKISGMSRAKRNCVTEIDQIVKLFGVWIGLEINIGEIVERL